MTIIQQVRCDQCDRLMASGRDRIPQMLGLAIDTQQPNVKAPNVSNHHFCGSTCLVDWLTKQLSSQPGAAPPPLAEAGPEQTVEKRKKGNRHVAN